MLALGGAAAVAEPEHRSSGTQRIGHPIGDASQLGHECRESRHDHLMVVDSLLEVHEESLDGRTVCA